MKTKSILTLFLLLFCSSAFACYNEYRTRLSKQMVWIGNEKLHFQSSFYTKQEIRDNINYPGGPKGSYPYEYKSDSAVSLCYLGKYEDALKAFLQIEKENPGLYATAANIGTTYELLGKNDSALKWIKKAISINPQSHKDSEWIHVKILEAKINAEKSDDENFLNGYNVLDLDWGNRHVPSSEPRDFVELRDHLIYQLNERLKFIKPKEPIMARLLFDLGNVCAFSDNIEMALTAYAKAEEFGYNTVEFKLWKTELQKLDKTKTLQPKAFHGFSRMPMDGGLIMPLEYMIVCIGILLLLLVALFFVIRNRIRKRRLVKDIPNQ